MPGTPAADDGGIIGRYYGDNAASAEHFAVIKLWMDDCLTHPLCCKTLSGAEDINARYVSLPTRCIEIMEGGNLFLRETTRAKPDEYTILSHRWNDNTKLSSTTTKNYELRKAGGEWEFLPKTFRDAIYVTAQLGLRYIWIDSICIIQDEDEDIDWKAESAKMATYYQQAKLTVAAVDASDEDGFLAPRNQPAFQRLVRLPYRDLDGQQMGHFFVCKPHVDSSDVHRTMHKDGLLKRGWVFQEWILSRRIVYYTASQIIFECQSRQPKNEFHETLLGEGEEQKGAAEMDREFWSLLKMRHRLEESHGIDTWYKMIEAYTRQQLKFPEKDYLKAIEGIAKECCAMLRKANEKRRASRQMSLKYVSGLWEQDLHHGLLWQVKNVVDPKVRVFKAPTWSWSSIQTEIIWPLRAPKGCRTRSAFELIKVHHKELEVDSTEVMEPSEEVDSPLVSTSELLGHVCDDPSDFRKIPVSLLIRGRIAPVLIREPLHRYREFSLVARSTGHMRIHLSYNGLMTGVRQDPNKFVTASWRAAVSPSLPNIIAGFGSFERPCIQDQLGTYQGTVVLALYVSKIEGVGYGSGNFIGAKILGLGTSVYQVLFLEPAGGQRYSRIGVGSIFDQGLKRELKAAAEQVIELI
jgi:hypothetical protein